MGRTFIIGSAHLKYMAEKKHYLIKVWDTSIKKDKKLDKLIETSSDGFDLVQEKIIRCYVKLLKQKVIFHQEKK